MLQMGSKKMELGHIYMDKNSVAYGLSKPIVGLERGNWFVSVIQNGHTALYNHEHGPNCNHYSFYLGFFMMN